MKYILDFDHTLLNTTAFVTHVETDDRKNMLITPDIWQYYNVRDFLFDDVLDWFKSKSRESLYILTAITPAKGPQAESYQKEKLANGKFKEFVSSVTLMIGEKGGSVVEIAKQFPPEETIVFVDDKIEQCMSVQRALPNAVCCLMVRHPDLDCEVKEVQGIQVVHTLADVDAIIEKI